MNYRREQVGRRISYIYLCLALSGAFGGLIASGLIRIESGPIVGWQYLYIVEGALTIVAGPIAYFWIPKELPQAWFYKPEEKEASAKRARILVKENQHTDEFSLREVFKGLTAWQVRFALPARRFR
jgi:MFS family permease